MELMYNMICTLCVYAVGCGMNCLGRYLALCSGSISVVVPTGSYVLFTVFSTVTKFLPRTLEVHPRRFVEYASTPLIISVYLPSFLYIFLYGMTIRIRYQKE
ncbi:hypothetical protein, unlikely [Trypanosoma brucei gambiense DAL972]|uniref:Uncharacterized protein n=1 Tax=Trypanosoma brucei gambiense (strain MHOM/CI/86/DAL972) TaxID=679716 RepID=C9ZTE4_TRYB9|nr:hypothetical protein, unlikely [Trypanosoma brucei gambiense DAL972]CBH12679.1 hypothetical protein, unlikely [Trypanosoma brucei gambiense DAL972]|eukprot:XP_011774959.1 hypothetical protein, unlikely [Trypanosoma brucei gambiense DAL972]